MKNILIVSSVISLLVACGGEDPGDFGLGVDSTGESIVARCGEETPFDDEDGSEELDEEVTDKIVLVKYWGHSSNGSRGCYHNNSVSFNCSIPQQKTYKYVQDAGPNFNPADGIQVNLMFGVVQGYQDIDTGTNFNLQSTNASATFSVRFGYSTGSGGDIGSGGFVDGSGTYRLSNAPSKLLGYDTFKHSELDINLDSLAASAKACFGNNPTASQYRKIARVIGRHETMHGLGFAHTSSNLPNSIMKAEFTCTDINNDINISQKQKDALNAFSPGDWSDTTLLMPSPELEH